jgi:predicted acylesterase/phospholipase RssA
LRPGLSVKQLGRPFFASIADLTDRMVKVYSGDTIVKQALMNSTAVPFWYKVRGERFDGGILNNLPVDHLDSKNGAILAFAFEEGDYVKALKNAFDLMLLMLDAATTNNTRLLKKQIDEDFVYPIQTCLIIIELTHLISMAFLHS